MSLGIEEDNKKTDEHILVCLSAAPSNKKIIDTAAKMANALQARFTAFVRSHWHKIRRLRIKKSWKNIFGMQKI